MDRPVRIDASAAPAGRLPLHDVAATRAIEQAAAARLPPHALMQRAGLAVARLALAVAPHARHVWIACGPGNNGGDGLEAALHLQRAGRRVSIGLAPSPRQPADAAASLARARAAGLSIGEAPGPDDGAAPVDLAIDAVFGIGRPRAAAGWPLDALRRLHALDAPLLSIDVPSGLDADHGLPWPEIDAVRARWTLALLTLKAGLFTAHGRDYAGEVWFDALGESPDRPPAAELLVASEVLWPARRHAQHKGSFGDVWVVGGALGMTGAAGLAARAALAAGAGRVHVVPLDPRAPAHDGLHPELMHRPPAALEDHEVPLEAATVVCGCGGGDAVRAVLPGVIGRAGRLLLDADALNALAADPALVARVATRSGRGRTTVATPHPLEAARLLGCTTAEIQADRLAAAARLAERLQATVVLKGSGSIVATTGCTPLVNASGNAALATAGSGDVLAGWTGGLWAQGLAAHDAAALGTHTHGQAADRWQAGRRRPGALLAGALVDALRDLGDA